MSFAAAAHVPSRRGVRRLITPHHLQRPFSHCIASASKPPSPPFEAPPCPGSCSSPLKLSEIGRLANGIRGEHSKNEERFLASNLGAMKLFPSLVWDTIHPCLSRPSLGRRRRSRWRRAYQERVPTACGSALSSNLETPHPTSE